MSIADVAILVVLGVAPFLIAGIPDIARAFERRRRRRRLPEAKVRR